MLVLILTSLLQAPPSTDWVVESREGRVSTGRWVGLSGEGLVLEAAGGQLEFERSTILLLHAPGRPEPVLEPRDVVVLATGGPSPDRLVGRLLGGQGDELLFEPGEGLPLSLGLDVIERVLPGVDRPLDRLAALEGLAQDDQIWRRRGDGGLDGVSGVVERLSGDAIVLESNAGALTFRWSEVLAAILANPTLDSLGEVAWPCRVALRGGSSFAAALVGIEDGRITFATRFVPEIVLSLDEVRTILFTHGAGVLPLADGDPLRSFESSDLAPGQAVLFPWRAGLGVAGGLLSVGGSQATTGFGVHATSRLVFAVPEGVSAFRVALGLTDDVLSLPARGSVGFQVLVDGEVRAAGGPVREGDPAARVRIDGLTVGQELELVVDAGGDDEAGDRAAWSDPVFLR